MQPHLVDPFDVQLAFHAETDNAIFVSMDANKRNAIWLPKKAIRHTRRSGGLVDVTLETELAVSMGFVN